MKTSSPKSPNPAPSQKNAPSSAAEGPFDLPEESSGFNLLSGSSPAQIRAHRAATLRSQVTLAQEALVNTLERELHALTHRLSVLSDIGPAHTTSLKLVDDSFNPEKFVAEVQAIRVDILQKQVEIKVARETLTQLNKPV